MKKLSLLILLALLLITPSLLAQNKVVNLYDSARVYYTKKDFKKAFYFYDTFYADTNNGQSNYDTYYAAVAACHAGNLERAKYYLKRSADVGYDLGSYDYFATDSLNKCLHDLPEWKKFIDDFKYKADSVQAILNETTAQLVDSSSRVNSSILTDRAYWQEFASKNSAAQLINKIKQFDNYPLPKKDNFWTLYHIKVNNALTVPFLVHIPKGYQPKHKTPLYVYLHGAIANRLRFTLPAYIPNGREIKIMNKVMAQDAFIIYPFGKKDFGWLYQQEAFETILNQIVYVKSLYNINDNQVYIGGHSNGGSGAFWYAVNKPSAFAAIFGLNYLPTVYGSNTSLRNLNNKTPFYGISGSEDTTFPINVVNSIYKYTVDNGANWKNFIKKGDHSLPISNTDSINFIFDTLATKTRNPFPKKIEWETDNIKNGRNLWIEITQLDTLAEKASWHTALNPMVMQNGKEVTNNFNKNKSGAVIATVEGNTINIQTSRVKGIRLYISAEMFDLSKQIKVKINNKDFLNSKLTADKNVILDEFLKTKDRDFMIANKIDLTIN